MLCHLCGIFSTLVADRPFSCFVGALVFCFLPSLLICQSGGAIYENDVEAMNCM